MRHSPPALAFQLGTTTGGVRKAFLDRPEAFLANQGTRLLDNRNVDYHFMIAFTRSGRLFRGTMPLLRKGGKYEHRFLSNGMLERRAASLLFHATRHTRQAEKEKGEADKADRQTAQKEDPLAHDTDALLEKTQIGLGFGGLDMNDMSKKEEEEDDTHKSRVFRVIALARPEAKLIAAALGALVIASGTNLLFPVCVPTVSV